MSGIGCGRSTSSAVRRCRCKQRRDGTTPIGVFVVIGRPPDRMCAAALGVSSGGVDEVKSVLGFSRAGFVALVLLAGGGLP